MCFCLLSLLFLMVLLGKILALLGHNEREKLEFCPFFKSVRKILFSSVFLSCSLLLCFLLIKRDEKEEKMVEKKFCFVPWHFTRKRKGRKNSFSLLRRKKRFLKRFIKSLLLLERTLCALEWRRAFFFFYLFFYIANSSILWDEMMMMKSRWEKEKKTKCANSLVRKAWRFRRLLMQWRPPPWTISREKRRTRKIKRMNWRESKRWRFASEEAFWLNTGDEGNRTGRSLSFPQTGERWSGKI